YVEDMVRAKAFYEAVFGVQLVRLDSPDMEIWAFPMLGERYGAAGALVRLPGVQVGANSVVVYFSCDDCAVQAARAANAGGQICKEKMSIGQYGHIALIADSEGNLIGLHSLR
ncbi:VOC family protein, partial [Accumulibacter sp.]|uniref:VOC family protein n=1 Tax=Accumulibacter sp. TaxID=2053492 RepID=UPI0025D84D05